MSDARTATALPASSAPPAGDAWSPLLRFAAGVGHRLVPWLVPLALIAVWQAASAWGWLSTRVLPAPLDVLRAAQALAESGELLKGRPPGRRPNWCGGRQRRPLRPSRR